MSTCNHDCENCNENCAEREGGCNHDCEHCNSKCNEIPKFETNEYTHIRKVIGVVSGKGGVGKSLVTSLLASQSNKQGYRTAILDGDILGPSICKTFGIATKAYGDESGKYIVPATTDSGIDIISTTMILENETDPVIWRGVMLSSIIQQFYSDVIYGEKDVLYIDMPPGTGDVPLTVFQSIPLDGIVIVTSPQDLVSVIVQKAINMANMMNVPIVGLVENYSYFVCPDCGKKLEVFGHSQASELAKEFNIPNFISLPIDPTIASYCDKGIIEQYQTDAFDNFIYNVLKIED